MSIIKLVIDDEIEKQLFSCKIDIGLWLQGTLLETTGPTNVNAISDFLLSNPVTSDRINAIANDQLTATYTNAITSLANVLGPLEKNLLVGISYFFYFYYFSNALTKQCALPMIP